MKMTTGTCCRRSGTAADSDLAGVLRAASDQASEGVQAAAQRELTRRRAVERTRNQAVQLNSSDLRVRSRGRRDAQQGSCRERRGGAGGGGRGAGPAPRFVVAERAPPATDELPAIWGCARPHRRAAETTPPSDETGWRRKRRWRILGGRTSGVPCARGPARLVLERR